MALSTTIKNLLNRFADTMPALRLPGLPYAESNPNLGDVLDAAIEAAAGSSSADDAAASAAAADASADAAAASALAAAASETAAEAAAAYTPAVTADWSSDNPATVAEALDRIAAALGPIA